MKHFIFLLSILSVIYVESNGQYLPKSIEPYRITVSHDKTSNLIFPSSIKSVDRGNESILAQKAPGIDNILQLKAGEENFKETNVTVVTSDGHFYSFAVSYNPYPGTLNYSFAGDNNEKAIVAGQPITTASYNTTAEEILQKKQSIHKISVSENIWLGLNNLFIADNRLWLEISITNNSLIPFKPGFLRMFMEDKKQVKNTAIQQSEITPLMPLILQTIDAHSTHAYVFVCQPFSVPYDKNLIIQTGEATGNRQLTLELNHRIMKKTKSLPQIINN